MILNAVSIFQEVSSIKQNIDEKAMRGLHKGQQESFNPKTTVLHNFLTNDMKKHQTYSYSPS
jgi:hypothetical protein